MKNCAFLLISLSLLASDVAAQSASRHGLLTTIRSISDLDLSGNFVYAIDIGGPGRTVGGLKFDKDQNKIASSANENSPGSKASPDTPGFYPCMNDVMRGSNDPDLGDENLDELLQNVRNDSVDFRVIQLDVAKGTKYKLQIMALSSSDEDRRFDLSVGRDSGAKNADAKWKAKNLKVANLKEQAPKVWTWTFTAASNRLWINCGKNDPQTGSDPNPCLSAITLEDLSNPKATSRPTEAPGAKSTLVTYPGPKGEPRSSDYRVLVNGKSLFVYTSYQKGPPRQSSGNIKGIPVSPVSFCYFDFCGKPVTVTVQMNKSRFKKSGVVVRPGARRIRTSSRTNAFVLKVTKPGPITVQPGGSLLRPLHIFANPIETDKPDPKDPNVIYYGPGIHTAHKIDLTSGKTLYVAGGAVVYCDTAQRDYSKGEKYFVTGQGDNIKVMGRGILCGRKTRQNSDNRVGIMVLKHGKNVKAEGVILRESSNWTFMTSRISGLLIDNVKVIGFDRSCDGIAICDTSNAVIRNSFCHNADDAMEIKVWSDMKNILFENNVVWTTVASAYGLAGETLADVSNVTYRNCTVINAAENRSRRAPIGLSLHGPGNADRFLFENIVIEYVQGPAMPPIRVQNNNDNGFNPSPATLPNNPYVLAKPDPSQKRPRGTISNVTFKNIRVLNAKCDHVVVVGDAKSSLVKNVTFRNVVINGQRLVPRDRRLWTNAWVRNLSVLPK
jgi:hypothetical protein